MQNNTTGDDIPLGLGMALAKNVDAMNYFSSLSKSQQQDVIKKTHQFNSMNEMQSYVDNMSNGQTFN